MTSEFDRGVPDFISRQKGWDLIEQNTARQQELVAQLATNFVHLQDICGKTSEDFISTLKNDPETIAKILALEIHPREQMPMPPMDVDQIRTGILTLRNQNYILESWIGQQVEYTLENLPEGKALRDDQQSALYLMTSSTAIMDESDDFLLKSQRARIGLHLSVPGIYIEEAEEEVEAFHAYVVANPAVMETYMEAAENGKEMGSQERLDFARFHTATRAKLDGRKAPEVFNHTLDDDTAADANHAGNQIRLQEKDNLYASVPFEMFLQWVNHEYDHLREGDKAQTARLESTTNKALGAEELDRHNAGLVLSFSKNTYFRSNEAPAVEGHGGLDLYQKQPKERYAEGIGKIWTQAVKDVSIIARNMEHPSQIFEPVRQFIPYLQGMLEASQSIPPEMKADVQNIQSQIMRQDLTTLPSQVDHWTKVQEQVKKCLEENETTPLTFALEVIADQIEERLQVSEYLLKIRNANKSEADLNSDLRHS